MTHVTRKTTAADPVYAMERNDAETQRLIDQAAFRDPLTRRLFDDAGITEGMKVLDLGTGAGDVAFLAADLVGPTGRVVGVDTDADVLGTARARAEARGAGNVEFVVGDLRTADPGERFDAVVGRFVLMYVADPATALRAAAEHLVPGGILALMEVNWRPDSFVSHPPVPLWGQVWDWMCETVERAGVQMHMGYELHRCFLEAGLPDPEMLLQAKVVPGTDADACAYTADTVRGLLPLMTGFGVATEEEVGIDTLARRLSSAAVDSGSVIKVSDAVGAHTRVPARSAF